MLKSTDLAQNLADIQGDILRGYHLGFARYLGYRVDSATRGRQWMRELAAQVTSAAPWKSGEKPDSTLNVAVSYRGLEALGLAASSLESFPEAFRQGMAERAGLLGDVGPDSPEHWEAGLRNIHVVVAVNAKSPDERDVFAERLRSVSASIGGASEQYVQDAGALSNEPVFREHFGYVDGISENVHVEGLDGLYPTSSGGGTPQRDGKWDPVKPGEFLLGYEDETGQVSTQPRPEALRLNGTYMAFRKLHQHVHAFRQFLRDASENMWGASDAYHQELLAAKLMGRWRSGCPLMLSPSEDNAEIARDFSLNNDFRYKGDPEGLACPLGAHVRRVNPRDGLDGTATTVRFHRLIRRGLPYGPALSPDAPDDGVDRGLIGVLINSNIERQFEIVQSLWIAKGEFTNLIAGEQDPITGPNSGEQMFTLPGAPLPFVFNLQRVVTLKGGEYFFMPGLAALRGIADGDFS